MCSHNKFNTAAASLNTKNSTDRLRYQIPVLLSVVKEVKGVLLTTTSACVCNKYWTEAGGRPTLKSKPCASHGAQSESVSEEMFMLMLTENKEIVRSTSNYKNVIYLAARVRLRTGSIVM